MLTFSLKKTINARFIFTLKEVIVTINLQLTEVELI